MGMTRFSVTYLEVLKGGKTVSSYLEQEDNSNNSNSTGNSNKTGNSAGVYAANYGSISTVPFQKIIQEMVLPKVVSVEGNKVTKVSMSLIDGYDCYYTTSQDDVLMVCFTKVDIPKILPIRVLSEVKQLSFDEIDSNIELRVKIGEILDKFHEELLNYRNENLNNNDPNNSNKNMTLGESTENDIEDVIQIMNDNIDKFLERQERVSLLVDKTSKLNTTSQNFKKKANRIKERMWWQRMKNTTLLIFAIILCVSALFIFIYVL